MTGFAQYDDYDGPGLAALVRAVEVSAGELLEEAITRTEQVNGRPDAVEPAGIHRVYRRGTLARAPPARARGSGPGGVSAH